jgi:L-glyceraldehyde 3-phosphate reductase
MALAWVLKDKRVSSVLVGTSSEEQLDESLAALKYKSFTNEELTRINEILDS